MSNESRFLNISIIIAGLAKLIVSQGVKETAKEHLGIDKVPYWIKWGFNSEAECEQWSIEQKEKRIIEKQTFTISIDEKFKMRDLIFESFVRGNSIPKKEKKWEKFEKSFEKMKERFENKKMNYFPAEYLAFYDVMKQLYEKKAIYQEIVKKENNNEKFNVYDWIDSKVRERRQDIELQNNKLTEEMKASTNEQSILHEKMQLLEEQKKLIEDELDLLRQNNKDINY